MKRTYLIKAAAFFLSLCLLCLTFGCSAEPQEQSDLPTLTVWVLSDEYKAEIERAFVSDFPSISWGLDVITVGASEVGEKLAGASESGVGAPDIFMLSPDMLCEYVNSDLTADLGALGISLRESSHYGYTIDAGTDSSGILRAVCYQPDPGLFFYRRSMAKVYLGTDDPDEIQAMLCDWDTFAQTARTIYSASNGKTCMTVGFEGMMMPFMATDSEGWVSQEGTLAISDRADEFMEYAAALAADGLVYDAAQWSDAWVAGISDTQSVFGYFSSGLGMKNVLKKACGGTVIGDGSYGDWAAVEGPCPYNWGGCWLAVSSQCDMQSEALTFLRYFISEEEAMKKNALISGYFCASRNVVDSIKFDTQFCDSFLSGQNYYNLLSDIAGRVQLGQVTKYDSVADLAFAECVRNYAFGRKSYEQATDDFIKTMRAAYPHLG
ncbi:MAG: carbohydrate ABC transporter substrate-binding protein [Clostridia bacterium]|nr:carbohydrate ABC transporter substrate-binding protein [Clostridia bacterium]